MIRCSCVVSLSLSTPGAHGIRKVMTSPARPERPAHRSRMQTVLVASRTGAVPHSGRKRPSKHASDSCDSRLGTESIGARRPKTDHERSRPSRQRCSSSMPPCAPCVLSSWRLSGLWNRDVTVVIDEISHGPRSCLCPQSEEEIHGRHGLDMARGADSKTSFTNHNS